MTTEVLNKTLPHQKPRRSELTALKWVILIVIAFLALHLGGFDQIRKHVATFDTDTLVLLVGLGALSRVFYVLRWQSIAYGIGLRRLTLAYLYRIDLLGEFVSIVLPSYLGGDGVRLIQLRQRGYRSQPVLLSILIDRVVGVMTLALLTLLALPLVLPFLRIDIALSPEVIAAVIAGGGAVMLLGLAIIVHLQRTGRIRLPAMLQETHYQVMPLVLGTAFSLLGHMVYATCYYVLFRDLTGVEYGLVMSVTLLALLTRTIPISLFGIELSDGSLVVLASMIGIASPLSLAVVTLILASRYLFAVAGLVIELIIDGKRFFVRETRAIGESREP